MFERFTTSARAVVEEGVRLATGATASQVRPAHLFEALLAEGTGVPAEALTGLGTSVEAVRTELRSRRDQYVDGLDADDADALASLGIDLDEVVRRVDHNLGPATATRRRPRFARESKQALELALRAAVAGRDRHLGPEHLLLGLVDTGDRLVVDTLAACGVQPAMLRATVADLRRRAG